MKKIFAFLLCTIGYIGCLWLCFRATVLEWIYIKESFKNFINPFIHFKVLFHLLSDLDIYVTGLCLWIGHVLMNSAENDNLKEKRRSSRDVSLNNNFSKLLKRFNLRKYGFFFFLIIFIVLSVLFFKNYVNHKFIVQNQRYENTIKELRHELLLKEHKYDELELQMKEDKKMQLLKELENEKDPIKYNKLKEYYNQLSFEAQ